MRPIKLTMQAFGPYTNKLSIDFSIFNNDDIFLITGNTGSGKTVIFDAISYALYGKASGSMREVSMLRNRSATSDIETFVQLDFEYQDKEYSIRRSPSYMRLKRSGDGETEQVAQAKLLLPDKQEITSLSEVNQKILDILKINQEQFSQIVMLAQNDFMKFLESNTNERRDILRTIFATDFYQNFEKELKSLLNIEKVKHSKLLNNYESLINSTKLLSEEFYALNYLEHKKVIELLSKHIADTLKKINTLELDENTLSTKVEKLSKTLALAISNNKTLSDYEKYKVEYQTLLKQEAAINKDKNNLALLKVISTSLVHIHNDLNKIDKMYNTEKNELKQSDQVIYNINKQLKVVALDYNNIDENELKLNKKRKKFNTFEILLKESVNRDHIKADIIKIKSKLETLNKQISSYLFNSEDTLRTLNEEYDLRFADYSRLKAEYVKLSEYYNMQEAIFLNSQASIMANKLKDNDECPVCGSTNHPKKAHSENDISEEDYLILKEKVRKQSILVEKELSEVEVLKKDLSNFEFTHNNLVLRLKNLVSIDNFNIHIEEDFDIEVAISSKLELDKIITEKTAVISAYSSQEDKLDTNDIKLSIQKLSQSIDDLDKYIKQTKNSYTALNNDLIVEETKNKQLSISVSKLELDYKKAHTNYLSKVNEHFLKEEDFLLLLKELENIEKLEVTIADYQKQVYESETLLKQYESLSKDLSFSNVDTIEKDIQSSKDSLLLITNDKHDAIASNKHNQEILTKLEKLSQDIAISEKDYSDIEILANTASGDLALKQKIKFETYAQMAYFDKVLIYANKRLKMMSNNQYELVRRVESKDLRASGGLDLDIIDHHYGNQRDVKTLSGGETFNASLALALGLSDAIMSKSGGIHMDALFIDEGFGSLSSEYLDNAINTLIEVASNKRLIGVISHVKDLRESITQQIIVSKDIDGSKVKIVKD